MRIEKFAAAKGFVLCMVFSACTQHRADIPRNDSPDTMKEQESIQVGPFALEIWGQSKNHVSFFVFKKGEAVLYREPLGPLDHVSMVRPDADGDPLGQFVAISPKSYARNGVPLVNLLSDGETDVLVEKRKSDGSADYLVF